MTGKLYVIGLGPGPDNQVTPQASEAISAATYFYGYKPYISRLKLNLYKASLRKQGKA